MSRYLKPWLTVPVLGSLGGEFEGVIASVTEEQIRNPHNAQKSFEPVVGFEQGGYRIVPNKGMLVKLIEWFGPDGSDWIGRRVRIFLADAPGKRGSKKPERRIACEDVHARYPLRRTGKPAEAPSPATDSMLTAAEIFGGARLQ